MAITLIFEDWCHAESMRETYLPGHQTTIKTRKGKCHAAKKVLAEPFGALDYKDFGSHCVCKVVAWLFCKVLVSEHIDKCDLGGLGTHATLAMSQP